MLRRHGTLLFLSQIIIIIAHACHKIRIVFERNDMIADTVQEIAVVADHHKTAVVVDQRFFQNAQRRKIQVVGRLVENQEIAAAAQNFGKRQTRFLAAGKIFDFRVDPVVFKQKTLQIPPDGNFLLAQIDEIVSLGNLLQNTVLRNSGQYVPWSI